MAWATDADQRQRSAQDVTARSGDGHAGAMYMRWQGVDEDITKAFDLLGNARAMITAFDARTGRVL